MRRLLVGHLEDEFRQIALGDRDANGFQRMVQPGLFRGNALPFHDQLHFMLHQHVADVIVGVSGCLGEKEVTTVGANAGFQLLQQRRQVRDGVFFGAAGAVFHRVIVGDARYGGVTITVEGLGVAANGGALHIQGHAKGVEQRLLVALVGHRAWLNVDGIYGSCHAHLGDLSQSVIAKQ